MTFFTDESGRNDPPVYVMAGYLMPSVALAAFEAAWQAELARPPAATVLKMKDLAQGNGEFRGVSQGDREQKAVRLAQIVLDHAIGWSAAVTLHADFENEIKGRIDSAYDDPYVMLHDFILSGANSMAEQMGLHGPIDFIFDRQIDKEKLLNSAWSRYVQTMEPAPAARHRQPPVFANDEDAIGLQAADMLAWHIRRAFAEGHRDPQKLSEAGRLLVARPRTVWLMDQEGLNTLKQFIFHGFAKDHRLPPHAEAFLAKDISMLKTCENFVKICEIKVGEEVQLDPLPAKGTARYHLVHKCAALDIPHLHRRSNNECLSETVAE